MESALVSHPKVAEAAVVRMPHDIKGQAHIRLRDPESGVEETDQLKKDLVLHVRRMVGPIASPDTIQFASAMPKTRSGKIMRRILRKIASGQAEELGDVSTLADPSVVGKLVEDHKLQTKKG